MLGTPSCRARVSRGLRQPHVVRGAGLAALALTLAAAIEAHALTARVRWLPSSGTVVGYDVFVRPSGQPYSAAIDAGLPSPGVGGALSHDVADLAEGVTYYFTVTARGSNGTRSACAGELVLGSPGTCRVESCCPDEACTFGSAPDGTPCDDADACRLCRAATCTSAAESALDSRRLRITERPRVSASGRFIPPAAFAPTADGLTVSFFDAAGTVLLTASVPPGGMRANPTGTAFVLDRDHRAGSLRMLSLRLRDGVARVRARLLADPGTSTGPLGWAVASGESCGRSAALACSVSSGGLSCR